MAEQRPGDGPDEQRGEVGRRGGADPEPPAVQSAPGAGAVPSGQPPAGGPPQLDEQQLEQFRQFQQFQQYLKFTEAQRRGEVVPGSQGQPVTAPSDGRRPPGAQLVTGSYGQPPSQPPNGGALQPATPPPRRPLPKIRLPRFVKRILASILSALIILAVLGIAGKLLYNHFFPAQDDNKPASETGGGTYHANKILSSEPYEAVRKVYQQIAQGRPDLACGYFDIPVQQTFAADLGYADCEKAVLDLKKQVTNVNDYAESLPSSVSEQYGDTVVVDSCRFTVTGGPALGVFTVTKVEKGQWLITAHQPGPRKCAPVPSTPTS